MTFTFDDALYIIGLIFVVYAMRFAKDWYRAHKARKERQAQIDADFEAGQKEWQELEEAWRQRRRDEEAQFAWLQAASVVVVPMPQSFAPVSTAAQQKQRAVAHRTVAPRTRVNGTAVTEEVYDPLLNDALWARYGWRGDAVPMPVPERVQYRPEFFDAAKMPEDMPMSPTVVIDSVPLADPQRLVDYSPPYSPPSTHYEPPSVNYEPPSVDTSSTSSDSYSWTSESGSGWSE